MSRDSVRAVPRASLLLAVLAVLVFFAAPAAAETELTFWNFWDQKFIDPVIARFETEHPGVKIRSEQLNWGNGLDKIVVALANGRAPDICELGSTWTGKFMSEGVLLDITERVSDLRPRNHLWEPVVWENRVYGLPWLVGTRVLFYNKALFKAAGLDPDAPPRTWDELLAAAKAIHRPDKGVYGFGVNAGEGHILYKKFLPFVWGNGGSILDGQGNFCFDSPATREALEFYRRLMAFGLKEKQDILDEAFKKGRLGLEISGSWNFAKYPKEAPDLDFGTALIPPPAAGRGRSCSFLGGQILVLFKNCKDPQAATEFLRYLTKAENTLPITKEALVSFPTDKAAYEDDFFRKNPKLGVFVKQMETGVHPPVHPLWIELESIINDAVEKVLYGSPVEEVMGAAATAYERVRLQFDERRRAGAPARTDAVPTHAAGGTAALPVWAMVLLVLTAAGTVVNAILLLFIYGEVKKNAA
ncbi:extracellular solute-binding protein [Candidatus Ozemobacteraceae bacterium]|nr:extracellular solute-binding protein [Candidatus Ozemobacteraceae bacterium]